MSEQKLQTKILNWLKAHDFWVFKTVVCSRKGIMDIIGCTPKGKFLGIEVKFGVNKPSKLQSWNVQEVQRRGGLAFVAWSIEEVQKELKDEY